MKQQVIERFEKELSFLISELYEINSYSLLYKHLYNKKNKPEFLKAMNRAPAFFGLTIHSYQRMFILGLSKICEKRNPKGKNIFSFLTFLEGHHSMIFSNISSKKQNSIDYTVIALHKIELENHSNCIENLLAWRDKSYAHYDKKYIGDNIQTLGNDFPITYGEIERLINSLGEILNTYQSAFNDTVTHLVPSNTYDVDIVLNALLNNKNHSTSMNDSSASL